MQENYVTGTLESEQLLSTNIRDTTKPTAWQNTGKLLY